MSDPAILLADLAAAVFMTGLAWFMQTVHLPLMLHANPSNPSDYVRAQRRRNTRLMVVPMTIEVLATVVLWRVYAATALEAVILLTTFAFYMPAHIRLTRHNSRDGIRHLIALNWIRTLSWSGRSAILLWTIAPRLHI